MSEEFFPGPDEQLSPIEGPFIELDGKKIAIVVSLGGLFAAITGVAAYEHRKRNRQHEPDTEPTDNS